MKLILNDTRFNVTEPLKQKQNNFHSDACSQKRNQASILGQGHEYASPLQFLANNNFLWLSNLNWRKKEMADSISPQKW